jgi:hypothetical protein
MHMHMHMHAARSHTLSGRKRSLMYWLLYLAAAMSASSVYRSLWCAS